MSAIHRMNLIGKPSCGASGKAWFSRSGVGVTCPECLACEAPPECLDDILDRIEAAAESYRELHAAT